MRRLHSRPHRSATAAIVLPYAPVKTFVGVTVCPCSRNSATARACLSATLLLTVLAMASCTPQTYVPELATRPYPIEQHNTRTIDIQCFRRGTDLEIVNATAHSFADFELWVNQRFMQTIDSLPAGATVRISLWDCVDVFGRRFYAGGFFRAYPSERVRMVQIQPAPDQPMIGLIAIRSEAIVEVTRQ